MSYGEKFGSRRYLAVLQVVRRFRYLAMLAPRSQGLGEVMLGIHGGQRLGCWLGVESRETADIHCLRDAKLWCRTGRREAAQPAKCRAFYVTTRWKKLVYPPLDSELTCSAGRPNLASKRKSKT